MATRSSGDSAGASSQSDSGSPTIADRLRTVAKVTWITFLALVVLFTFIPTFALLGGYVPFDAPPTTPYFALVGATLVGVVALVAIAIYDV